jgi:hypothetical protein
MKCFLKLACICFAAIGVSCVAATITFDELGVQPVGFNEASPLRDQYAELGVHFRGPTIMGGGAILDQDSSFGINPRSGRDFLAFSVYATLANGGVPAGPEKVTFDNPVSSVSIYASTRYNSTFTLRAFDLSRMAAQAKSPAGWSLAGFFV